MIQFAFNDEKFDQPGEWADTHVDEHFAQRYLKEEELIYCETLMTVHGTTDIEAAIALLRGPWDWWEHGQIADFVAHEDGSSDQTLSPVWWFITRVGLQIFPPVDLPLLRGRRLPMMLSKDFTGPASMDVYPGPDATTMIVRGRFHGVAYQVPLIPTHLAEGLHLNAESGTMPPPFPKGTGWVGLLHTLESQTPRQSVEKHTMLILDG